MPTTFFRSDSSFHALVCHDWVTNIRHSHYKYRCLMYREVSIKSLLYILTFMLNAILLVNRLWKERERNPDKQAREKQMEGHNGSEFGNEGQEIMSSLFDHLLVSSVFFGKCCFGFFFQGVRSRFLGFAVGHFYWRSVSFSRKQREEIWFRGRGHMWGGWGWRRFRGGFERLQGLCDDSDSFCCNGIELVCGFH